MATSPVKPEGLGSPLVLVTAAALFGAALWAGLGIGKRIGKASRYEEIRTWAAAGGTLAFVHAVEELVASQEFLERKAAEDARLASEQAAAAHTEVAALDQSLADLKAAVASAKADAEEAERKATAAPDSAAKELNAELAGLQDLEKQAGALKAAAEAERAASEAAAAVPGANLPQDLEAWSQALTDQWRQGVLKDALAKISTSLRLRSQLKSSQEKWSAMPAVTPNERERAVALRREFTASIDDAKKAVGEAQTALREAARQERAKFEADRKRLEQARN